MCSIFFQAAKLITHARKKIKLKRKKYIPENYEYAL